MPRTARPRTPAVPARRTCSLRDADAFLADALDARPPTAAARHATARTAQPQSSPVRGGGSSRAVAPHGRGARSPQGRTRGVPGSGTRHARSPGEHRRRHDRVTSATAAAAGR
ncbi:MAG: hypothetical protein MZW92_03935 [Comamonadaceae bacterium]|nr:hypothetical protein [Comamonadaceae bacterium]